MCGAVVVIEDEEIAKMMNNSQAIIFGTLTVAGYVASPVLAYLISKMWTYGTLMATRSFNERYGCGDEKK